MRGHAPRGSQRRWWNAVLACGVWASLVVTAAAAEGDAEDQRPADASAAPGAAAIDFNRDVRPIFSEHCYRCHGPQKQRSSFRLDRRAAAMKGGDYGEAILAGNSDDSPLVRYAAGLEPGMEMPPEGEGERLMPEKIGILRRWIDGGAHWPDDGPNEETDLWDWWAYRSITRPPLPAITSQAAWVRTPVDAFIIARLEESGLSPSPAADRRTFIRRLSFDLLGLPPTAEEVAAFIADDAPDAAGRLVDRLLASPHYGERWARHWMDLVHFAETHGHDQDRPRDNAWPYRDYLIRAFNADLPYERFVEQQIAGDVLSDDPAAVTATGFLAAGPWDESSLRDIREDSIDREIGRYLDRDDIVSNVSGTFLSTTVHCARCHDHKFDPIAQADYYGLQAVFAGTDKGERLYDADPQTAVRRGALQARLAELPRLRDAVDSSLLTPALLAETAEWERRLAEAANHWQVLTPVEVRSAEGSELAIQADGSVLSGGVRPEKDVYTLVCRTAVSGITGMRLEVLTDPSLPHQGPGRQDNGNLHLSELTVTAAPVRSSDDAQTLVLQNPRADFDQAGWTIGLALDGNAGTAWGIHPQVGQPHRAVFELAEPLTIDGEVLLTFELQQLHGGGHLIGRPRVSITTAPSPASADAQTLPAEVAAALSSPRGERQPQQQAAISAYYLQMRTEQKLASLPAQSRIYSGSNQFQPDGSFRPSPQPRVVHLLRRGDIRQPAGEVQPAALPCLTALPARWENEDLSTDAARRGALAKWISDRRNPLTWRSIANRVWQHHFGRGIVDTANDFGRMGSVPTHPELLDWLACELLENGGSLKHLHRLICTSAVYRQGSSEGEDSGSRIEDSGDSGTLAPGLIDAENRLLWRMNRRRLDAESVHDAIAAASGRLDTAMGGPSARQFVMSPGVHVTPTVDYQGFDVDNPALNRRSVYRFLFRTLPDPFMETLDCPDASQFAPVRNVSVTALQALAMMNDRYLVRQCEHLAERAAREGGDEIESQIDRLYSSLLQRAPTGDERRMFAEYAKKHGLANAARVLVNSNEFLFLD